MTASPVGGARNSPARRLVTAIVAFPHWLFGPRLAALDVSLGLLAASWFGLLVARPELFDRGTLRGIDWLPDPVWITFTALVTGLHVASLVRPAWRTLRIAAVLIAAWCWIFVGLSLVRVTITPGVCSHLITGLGCLFAAIYLAGQPRAG